MNVDGTPRTGRKMRIIGHGVLLAAMVAWPAISQTRRRDNSSMVTIYLSGSTWAKAGSSSRMVFCTRREE